MFGYITYFLTILLLPLTVQNKAVIKIRIFDYINLENKLANNTECDFSLIHMEKCDPVFSICISWKERCDILTEEIYEKDKSRLSIVYSYEVSKPYKPNKVTVNVTVNDKDDPGKEHIGNFSGIFVISELEQTYKQELTVSPVTAKARLFASFKVICSNNYYGDQCETFCEPKFDNYRCDPVSGKKICLLNCGKNKECLKTTDGELNESFICKCKEHWYGAKCDRYDEKITSPSPNKSAIGAQVETNKPLLSTNTVIIIIGIVILVVLIILISFYIGRVWNKRQQKKKRSIINNNRHEEAQASFNFHPVLRNSLGTNSLYSFSCTQNSDNSSGYIKMNSPTIRKLPLVPPSTSSSDPAREQLNCDSVYEEPMTPVINEDQYELVTETEPTCSSNLNNKIGIQENNFYDTNGSTT